MLEAGLSAPVLLHRLHVVDSRATLGLLRPKHRILGGDVAGRVEKVGSGVTQFKPRDDVYANLLDHGLGGFAEYVSVPVEVVSEAGKPVV